MGDKILLTGLLVVAGLVLSLFATGTVLVRLPADHFVRARGSWKEAWRGSVGRKLGTVAKNLAGVILIAAGLLLSIPGVPGQGLMTVLLGLFLIDFPGKHRLQLRLLRPRRVRRVVNRLRARFRRPDLELPPRG